MDQRLQPISFNEFLKRGFHVLIFLYILWFFGRQISAGRGISFEYFLEWGLLMVTWFAVFLALAYPVFRSSHKSMASCGLAVSLTSLFWGLLLSACMFIFTPH